MPYEKDGAGWKRGDTSEAAAKAVSQPQKQVIRQKVLDLLEYSIMGMNADEICEILNVDPFSVRPRLTELFNDGLIQDTGLRRKGNRGRSQKVWEMKR